MAFLDLTSQQVADITAYLIWDGTGTPPLPDPPAAPTSVQATDGLYTDKVAVSWSAPFGATGYEVWCHTTDSSADANQIGSATTTNFDDTPAAAGATHYCWVKATNAAGASGFSASDAGHAATAPHPVPPAPANVQASHRTHTPGIFNTNQGSQFTSKDFTSVLKDHDVRISMDGRGRALDNVFIELLWRTVKYEDIYLREYNGGSALHADLSPYFEFYNHDRPLERLGKRTTACVYRNGCPPEKSRAYLGRYLSKDGGKLTPPCFQN